MAVFRIRGFSRRLYVAFLLTAVFPVTVAGGVGVFYSLGALRKATLDHLDQEVTSSAAGMGRFIRQLRSELVYMSASATLLELVDSMSQADSEHLTALRRRLAGDYVAFAETYPYIYQIRYLDDRGREVIRVERSKESVHVVPFQNLQDKSDRYYVAEALALEPGEIYVSPMDLNVEWQKPEQPEKPVVRFATPVANRFGTKAGILIINLHADFLLGPIRQLASARGGVTYLFNRSGFYLAQSGEGPAQSRFQMQTMEDLAKRFPRDLLARFLAGRRGTEIVGDWIVAYGPVDGTARNAELRAGDDRAEWVVALAYPQRRIFAAVFNLNILYGLLALSLAVAMVAGYWMSRRLLQPLSLLHEETEEITKGNFSRRVETVGSDEIADLGRSFNVMAARLEETYHSLKERKDRLEQEVAARTAALEKERQNLLAIIGNTADGILAVGSGGEIELANDAARRLFGQEAPALEGQRIGTFWPGWAEFLAADAGGGAAARRYDLEFGGRTLSLSIAAVAADGRGQGYILVLRDVSEDRRLQEDRRTLDQQMFQTEKMAALGEMAMGLAHEIGNPLAGIKAVVQALRADESVTAAIQKRLSRVESEINRLTAFLRSFDGYTAPQPARPTACRLEDVVEDVLFWTRNEAKSRGVGIRFDESQTGVPDLWADPNQLKQVLLNLVLNAVQAMPAGGTISIGACAGGRGSAERASDGKVRLCVIDDGPGIAPEIVGRIFEPFFTTRPQGSGLGLAVVKKIACEHGAEISVDSRPGRGTRFELRWPVARPRRAAQVAAPLQAVMSS